MSVVPPATDDPATVGPYRVLGVLGSGGMGRVYLASGVDGRRVAVKVVRSDLASDDRFRARFRREIDAARRVPARYTARVLDAGPDDPRPWVASEYVAGPSLDAYVREHGPLGGRALRGLAVALFRALVALGRAGLVHRDLKPSNVLLDGGRPDRLRVVDFGIARAADDTRLTSTGALLGTPAYMAPEQAIGDGEAGPAADVHAAGAMLVFAATGSPPYAAASAAAVLYRQLHGQPDLGATPDPERGWAARCLRREAAERPDPARLLAEARRPVRRAAAAVAGAVVLLLVAAVVALTVRGDATGPSTSTTPATPATATAAVDAPVADPSVPGGGAAATAPPAAPATTAGPVVDLGHRAGRVVAGVNRVYVSDPDTGTVTAMDPRGRVVGRVDVGRFPSALALSPDGTRLYAALTTGGLVAVGTADMRVAATAELGSGDPDVVLAADVAVTPDGRTVVVADPRRSRVTAVDAVSLRRIAERALDEVPRALAVSPDGGRALLAVGVPGLRVAVTVLALPALTPVATAPGVPDALDAAADPDGDRVYVSTSGQSVSSPPEPVGLRVLGADDGRVRSVLDAVPTALRLVAGPGGRWLYALDPQDGGIVVLDTASSTVVSRNALEGDGEDAAVSPDGRALYVLAGSVLRVFTAQ